MRLALDQANDLRISRAATFPKYASTRSPSHNRFGSRYQAAGAASDCTRLLARYRHIEPNQLSLLALLRYLSNSETPFSSLK